MYAGKIVEQAPVEALFVDPQHPYTRGLLGSIPRLDVDRERLATIEGYRAFARQPARGCPLRAALPVRRPPLPRGTAAAAGKTPSRRHRSPAGRHPSHDQAPLPSCKSTAW